MNQYQNQLEDRTLKFAQDIIDLCKKLPNNTVNFKLIDQIIRSAASVGANYREATESLSIKDQLMRLRISRKEAKETTFWLQLISHSNPTLSLGINKTSDECQQLRNILSAIILKKSKHE